LASFGPIRLVGVSVLPDHTPTQMLIPPTLKRLCCSLALLSRHHFTALPSPERYGKRYGEEVFKKVLACCDGCVSSTHAFALIKTVNLHPIVDR
jgi:hypothetical protein